MVGGSRGAPEGAGNYMAVVLGVILLSGCSAPVTGGAPHAAASPRVKLAAASPSPSASGSYWVLSTLGLKLHQSPDLASASVAVIRPGVRLDATGAASSDGHDFLHVHAHDSANLDGWIVNDPLLVTTTPMQQYTSSDLALTLLYPSAWSVGQGPGTASFQASGGSPKLTVQMTASADQLGKPPPGHETREEGPVDVYGKSPLIYHYAVDTGGYDLEVSLTWAAGRVYRFAWQAPADDSLLFTQVLASVAFT